MKASKTVAHDGREETLELIVNKNNLGCVPEAGRTKLWVIVNTAYGGG